ncbi:DUF4332 domain-containing protein [Hyphomicrobium sp.]|uniref:DUF4332 domain-containing protein n=1 Tax=Hyphomicrobium sp. TaxID=82 RepID=UPI002D769F9D|nr:DUF4332 domain-containing protein [Hyphomicrobium sp.]HET6390010.1 DUF4332 domain-containing protein [Hyphomicrobium sp.]
MSLLYRIVYATHANGTHHKLALDALQAMARDDREEWTRLFLKHVELYLDGAKAPDVTFKDFKNHVLHVSENYWGGALEKVNEWYGRTVFELKANNWPQAVYAAGVLSHYFTDPVMPFHTGQTEAENAVHRAAEWSISRSYNELRAIGERRYGAPAIRVPTGPHWLSEFVCNNAEFAHGYYEKLIAHYDIHKGATRPEEGLDTIGRNIVAELLIYASVGFGKVLDRAIAEANVLVPAVDLTSETFLSLTQIPRKFIEKRLTNAEDRQRVAAIYDELRATGTVRHALTEDDKTIRDLHYAEVLAPQMAQRSQARAARIEGHDNTPLEIAVAKSAAALTSVTAQPPALPQSPPPPRPRAETMAAQADQMRVTASSPTRQWDVRAREARPYLSGTDDLEAAPSIGAKTAERIAAAGIFTVGDFLEQNPEELAHVLDDPHFDAETLLEWQEQARLVIDVPGLRGTHAQLLVGAGYRTAQAVADADPIALSADVLRFAMTSEGKRVLREGRPPDIEKIKSWVDFAKQAVAA